MRWLVVSRDRRFHEALRREAPDGVCYAAATDAAAALRVLLRERIDGAVLDAAADPGMSREFLAWWSAAAERRRMPLLVAGRAGAPGPTGARYVERDPAAVTAALGREATGVLDIGMRRLRGAGGETRLTPAEAAVVEYLLHARGPVSARICFTAPWATRTTPPWAPCGRTWGTCGGSVAASGWTA